MFVFVRGKKKKKAKNADKLGLKILDYKFQSASALGQGNSLKKDTKVTKQILPSPLIRGNVFCWIFYRAESYHLSVHIF